MLQENMQGEWTARKRWVHRRRFGSYCMSYEHHVCMKVDFICLVDLDLAVCFICA